MALATCDTCGTDEGLFLARTLDDGRKVLGCRTCGGEQMRGQANQAVVPGATFTALKREFPTMADVPQADQERSARLKAEFLTSHGTPDPEVAPYWAKYQQVFSREGLFHCDPQLLKDFANNDVGARPGNQSMFNDKWNEMGTERAAEMTRRTLEYLLYGPETIPMEDRLNHLLENSKPFAMPGFKEALLTRALCVVQPERFLSILTYTSPAGGKREIAKSLYGLDLPAPDSTRLTRGRLILWSNDLMRELVGHGFVDQPHAARFLWWAKDEPR